MLLLLLPLLASAKVSILSYGGMHRLHSNGDWLGNWITESNIIYNGNNIIFYNYSHYKILNMNTLSLTEYSLPCNTSNFVTLNGQVIAKCNSEKYVSSINMYISYGTNNIIGKPSGEVSLFINISTLSIINNVYVAIINNYICYSSNGIDWTSTLHFSSSIRCTRSICIASSNLYSINGINWTISNIDLSSARIYNYKDSGVFINNMFYIDNNNILVEYKESSMFANIINCNEEYCYSRYGGAIYFSKDLSNWIYLYEDKLSLGTIISTDFIYPTFMAFNGNTLYYCEDGFYKCYKSLYSGTSGEIHTEGNFTLILSSNLYVYFNYATTKWTTVPKIGNSLYAGGYIIDADSNVMYTLKNSPVMYGPSITSLGNRNEGLVYAATSSSCRVLGGSVYETKSNYVYCGNVGSSFISYYDGSLYINGTSKSTFTLSKYLVSPNKAAFYSNSYVINCISDGSYYSKQLSSSYVLSYITNYAIYFITNGIHIEYTTSCSTVPQYIINYNSNYKIYASGDYLFIEDGNKVIIHNPSEGLSIYENRYSLTGIYHVSKSKFIVPVHEDIRISYAYDEDKDSSVLDETSISCNPEIICSGSNMLTDNSCSKVIQLVNESCPFVEVASTSSTRIITNILIAFVIVSML